ncbi:YhjD/YihY/BrkB family envelope integrity protein, partial [Oleiphilus sp. HI0079]
VGAIVAGIIWQIAGQAFTAFVVSSARYDVIYSGFAVGIVALLWLYASWLILLLGSSIAFYLQNDNYITRVLNVKGSPVEIEQLALRVMIDVADAQERRSSPIKQDALESIRGVPGVLVREVVETLLKGKLIIDAGKDGDCFVLARSSDLISVADILSLARQKHSRHLADIPEGVRTIAKDLNQFIETQYSEKTLRDLIST